jgi:hypothetical protein
MTLSLYDSTRTKPKKGKKRVADRTPEEVAAYKQNMEEVRDEVELIRGLVAQGDVVIEPSDLKDALDILGVDLVEGILHDLKERPHRRICQGRAASCHPESDRRSAYVIVAGAQRSVIERAIGLHRGQPDSGPRRPQSRREDSGLAQYRSSEGVYSFGDGEEVVENQWQKQLRLARESMQTSQN